MKVIHLLTGDATGGTGGGAAKGVNCLHTGLKEVGVESKIITDGRALEGEPDIITVSEGRRKQLGVLVRRQLERLPLYLYQNRGKEIFSTGIFGYDFTKTEIYKWADVIHLHWINAGFVDVKDLRRIEKPIIWTMHDMWPMTGGCHYPMSCERYLEGCGYCKQLNSKYKYDLSHFVMARKRKYLPKHLKLVGVSDWLSNCARKSHLLKSYDIRTIYNNIDLESFFPLGKETAKEVLGIKTKKKIILVGAQRLDAFYKGFDKYLDCLANLDKKRYYLLFFGHLNEVDIKDLGYEYMNLGFLNDTLSLRLVYSASDVFVAPSVMEAFGKTLAEAMACGTPVVCFDATGPKEIVDHGETGYRAKPYESKDLALGIEWVAESPDYPEMCRKARAKVEKSYGKVLIAKQHQKLYKELCGF